MGYNCNMEAQLDAYLIYKKAVIHISKHKNRRGYIIPAHSCDQTNLSTKFIVTIRKKQTNLRMAYSLPQIYGPQAC